MYIIYRDDDSEQYVMYRTTNGDIAVPAFRSRDLAQHFIAGKGMSSEWKVVESTADSYLEWLRGVYTQNNATKMAIDPDPVTSATDARVIPIVALLIEIEGSQYKTNQ